MRRNAGLSLIETVVVVAAVVVGVTMLASLVAVLMPGLGKARELARRAYCKANISAIGKGLAIYTSANRDKWPWLVSDNHWDAATGESRQLEPSEKTNYNVSALLFLLVRDGQGPDIFVCPSTKDTPDPNTDDNPKDPNSWNWDFSPYKAGSAEHLSYSYQAPLVNAKETQTPKPVRQSRRPPVRQTAITPPVPEAPLRSGVDGNSEAGLVVLAERTPAYAGLKPDFDWAKPGKDDSNTGMSQNHTRGQMINLLFADLHVGESLKRADCGINYDNVYSAAGAGENGKPLDVNQGPGSMKLADHKSPQDSFLIGPVKMEKAAREK